MKTQRLVWMSAMLLLATLVGTASAGVFSGTGYTLYWLDAPGGAVKVWGASTAPLPPGRNVPPNNHWRYDYADTNKHLTNTLNTF